MEGEGVAAKREVFVAPPDLRYHAVGVLFKRDVWIDTANICVHAFYCVYGTSVYYYLHGV